MDVNDHGEILVTSNAVGTAQLVLVAGDGTRRPVTDLGNPCEGRFANHPGGVFIQVDADGDGRYGIWWLSDDRLRHGPAKEKDLTPVTDNPNSVDRIIDVGLGWLAYMTNRRNGTDFDVVLLHLESGVERILYDRGGHVSQARVNANPLNPLEDWALALSVFTAQSYSMNLMLIINDQVHRLCKPADPSLYTDLAICPDLTSVVAATNHGSQFQEVRRITTDGGESTLVRADDSDVTGTVSPDGTLIAAITNHRGRLRLDIHDTSGQIRSAPDLEPAGGIHPIWSPHSDWLAVQLNLIRSPSEIYVVDPQGHSRLLISAAADHQLIQRFPIVQPRYAPIGARDAETIPCHVYASTTPVSLRPAVVLLHGGPESQEFADFSPLKQYLSQLGFVVVTPDVRGSTGYGKRWYGLDDRRLRLDAVDDLRDLHSWLPTLGADPRRTALVGGSYGGYLTLAGLAFQPELWAAGVDIMGISNLVTYLERTADYRRAVRECEYGYLDTDRDFLQAASPLHRADQIRAPLLIIHGANDPRVPLSESQAIADALCDHHLECDLMVFADEGHGLTRRHNRIAAYQRIVEFLTKHLDHHPL